MGTANVKTYLENTNYKTTMNLHHIEGLGKKKKKKIEKICGQHQFSTAKLFYATSKQMFFLY